MNDSDPLAPLRAYEGRRVVLGYPWPKGATGRIVGTTVDGRWLIRFDLRRSLPSEQQLIRVPTWDVDRSYDADDLRAQLDEVTAERSALARRAARLQHALGFARGARPDPPEEQ